MQPTDGFTAEYSQLERELGIAAQGRSEDEISLQLAETTTQLAAARAANEQLQKRQEEFRKKMSKIQEHAQDGLQHSGENFTQDFDHLCMYGKIKNLTVEEVRPNYAPEDLYIPPDIFDSVPEEDNNVVDLADNNDRVPEEENVVDLADNHDPTG